MSRGPPNPESRDDGGDEGDSRDVVGIVPAAGRATRLARLPGSKEVYPLAFRPEAGDGGSAVVAAEVLLDAMARGGADRAFVVLRRGKWDVPDFLRGGDALGLPISYLVVEGDEDAARRLGAPFTVDRARPFTAGSTVLFGFPDIVFRPPDALRRLRIRLEETGADLVLGLFPADRPEKVDMVSLDEGGRVRGIAIKPRATELRYTWLLAAWTPAFTERLHAYVDDPARRPSEGSGRGGEHYVGDVIRTTLEEGLIVETVPFDDGRYIDIGTPADLARAVREFSRRDGWNG